MAELKEEMEKGTRDLVQWASNVRLEEIPEAVLRRAVLIIADDLAAMVASRKEPEVVSIQEQILRNTTEARSHCFSAGAEAHRPILCSGRQCHGRKLVGA